MKTIAIMNYKGGVGKTVTTINFAAELAAAGKSVIVMDADGQCNLSDIFRADTLHGGTTYEVLTGETGCCWDELVQDTPVEGVKIVPASAELPKADIAALTGERLAKNGIRDFCLAVAEDEGADYILIDCPTAYNAATVAALGAADEIIIPVELEGFSLHGAGEIRSQVANMRTVNPRLRIAGALITKRRGTRIQEAAEQALRVSGIPAFEAAIPLRASVPASMSNLNASKTLMGYAPKDAATKAYTSASSSSRKKCSLSQIRKSLPNRSSATRSCIKCIRKRSSEKMRPDRLLKGYAQRPKAGSQVLKPAALTVLVPSTGSNAITSPSLILREIQCAGRSLASALMTAVKKLV